ncbi:hypothetical protein SAMN04487999_3424 [Leeuwenhoekiella palythoae]|uniref:Uncharacterized protein n=1 Tax=Leeuwenhoekiella palythoae TaxID=573501 RepID=A0A1M5ZRP0_9FLAO|nr:hypothetical protein SAMN04487999_3424 [Leeuwenhoekiella palythoae]
MFVSLFFSKKKGSEHSCSAFRSFLGELEVFFEVVGYGGELHMYASLFCMLP